MDSQPQFEELITMLVVQHIQRLIPDCNDKTTINTIWIDGKILPVDNAFTRNLFRATCGNFGGKASIRLLYEAKKIGRCLFSMVRGALINSLINATFELGKYRAAQFGPNLEKIELRSLFRWYVPSDESSQRIRARGR
jgi:hypothetical protein